MLNKKLEPLYQKLAKAQEALKQAQTEDDFLALGNYLGNLYCSLICMGDTKIEVNKVKCFGSEEEYQRFVNLINQYMDRHMENFIATKPFHFSFCQEVLPTVEDELAELCSIVPGVDEEQIPPEEFKEILFSFLSDLGMVELFEKFLKEKRIHSCVVGTDEGKTGFFLYNAAGRDSDLFVKDFQYTISRMGTLVHEFGHGYDLAHFEGDVKAYNQYFYLSFFTEVLSTLNDRLLKRYCLRNGIYVPDTKNCFVDFEMLNHDNLLQGYILSALKDDFLRTDQYIHGDPAEIISQVKDYFIEGAPLDEYVQCVQKIDMQETISYLYGDILSLFLAEEVEKNGMNSDLLEYFMTKRGELFREGFMRECGFVPGNYAKLYQKEAQLIKK